MVATLALRDIFTQNTLAVPPQASYEQAHVFKVGDTYTNDQIRFSLDLENLGGIRPALNSSRILGTLRVTAAEDSGRLAAEESVHDRIEGNILIYTAQGREGDQVLAGRNKRLVEQYSVQPPFFGFTNIGRQTYRFLGLLGCCATTKKIKLTRRAPFGRSGCLNFGYMTNRTLSLLLRRARFVSASLLAESRQNNPSVSLEREVAPPSPKVQVKVKGQHSRSSKQCGCDCSRISHHTTLNVSLGSCLNGADLSKFL